MERQRLRVSEVKIRLLGKRVSKFIGWASCVVNDSLYLNNIAIRRTKDGKVFITFPAEKSGEGSKYFYFNPINQEAARVLEKAIIDKLRLAGDAG